MLDEAQDGGCVGTPTLRSTAVQTNLSDFNPSAAFPGPVSSLPPYTQSVASATSTKATDPYHISTPKPDMTVGLAHTPTGIN